MTGRMNPKDPPAVLCEMCGRPASQPEALHAEIDGRTTHFCGPDCYENWRAGRVPPPAPHEIHGGTGRSKVLDERMKDIARQHPQRDEPRVDSVEQDDLPSP